ncbi:hypothetical protein ASG54_04330 [Aureimonas sp. Leaf460]|nr:hypothetical protein ASG54_04330 [Aureimonas sp. Leaf460]KQT69128.1 hypothetical protein ASG62_16935 [Aureimonas sp. Leaf427]
MTAEIRLRERQSAIARARETDGTNGGGGGGNDDGRVADKWQLLRALSEARERFGVSDRTISVLEALLSFQPGKAIDGAQPIIVFPSNRELSLRTRGMAPATLRRHIAALIQAGLLLRRDSPNGKRYRRRDESGEGGEEAFGFDLSALAFRAGDIFEAAEIARREDRIARRLRAALSLHRRDIRKVVEAALVEARPGDWMAYAARLAALTLQRTARAPIDALEAMEADLVRLRAEVETAYLDAMTDQEMSANDDRSERHYQNSKPDLPIDSKPGAKAEGNAVSRWSGEGEAETPEAEAVPERAPEVRGMSFDLATVLSLCPDITAYALQPMRDWRSFVTVAHLVRGFLGISPDAWHRACEAMGEIQAATVIAAMLQRSDRIASPGGYLRSLTARAAKGQFRVEPMLRALA